VTETNFTTVETETNFTTGDNWRRADFTTSLLFNCGDFTTGDQQHWRGEKRRYTSEARTTWSGAGGWTYQGREGAIGREGVLELSWSPGVLQIGVRRNAEGQ